MTSTIAVFAATRADVSPLVPVLSALAAASDLEPVLFASASAPDTVGFTVEPLPALDPRDPRTAAESGARLGRAVAEAIERLRPAAFVVLGDRWELLYAVPPALLYGLPIVHLHGGELTEGAIDDRVRHAVTKLADLHCVSTEQAAARLRQLGEPDDRIVITGAPSLDSFRDVQRATDELLGKLLGRDLQRPLALVTYHPVTAGGPDPASGAHAVLSAVAATCEAALVTHPGMDAGRDRVLAEIRAAVAESPVLAEVPGLGTDYLPVLAAADVIVGNSSSGVIEAASFGVPVVDVGDRQRGRVTGPNVVHVPEEETAIKDAIRRCLRPDFRAQARSAVNVYGDGKAAPRIVDVIRRAARGGLLRKPFVDRRGSA